ncbi:methyl-accepting chemotaxis protein [Marinobacter persicus]|uniref:Methyl-accepting chemotaxis sensory transducer with Pas/Pac sensor n=1 Tax=Marinobacter persicus TaxID=930118 RepID=A0A2S6GB93_9GAMM|nr:PAS domain-containing methyl-accepting chemotaxis protein [Marinobacter persicus]PPK53698.1 methyl-accepting chemotaxis sensory transducer with Pas/Pac sensor [Marinobacter persicus]PPK56512.1 methyl-accepting chemotaxis sensory transducer with Pas/Pac sensor [Marinobacter persicus]PPK60085.1 methyl-accepting chemotaxis sensory transducer with Pas/Pac sensor [Marinobacter persicus]
MRRNEPVTGKEHEYPSHYHLISTTDLKGKITAVNEDFVDVAGFNEDELIGRPHNMIRHPDMPPEAFENLWQTVQAGDSWRGIVKNRCKNGDHYWVDAYVTPIKKNGQIVEYQSVRCQPSRAQIQRAEAAYAAWNKGRIPRRYQAISPPMASKLACLYAVLAGSLVIFGLAALTLIQMAVLQALVLAVFAILFWLTLPMMRTARDACCDAHPVMPWIYTGLRDESAWIEYDRQKRDATLRAVSARMHSNIGMLHGKKQKTMEWVSSSVDSVRNQQTDIEHITRAFEELAQSVRRVSDMTTRTEHASQEARQSAHQCQDRMDGVNQAISQLRGQLDSANTEMDKLSERSDAISVVLEVITEIAEQTNLLALNAAIEAARAGEAGRGFAVVADEIRGLARRTHESTQRIDTMIDELQSETHMVVDVINKGSEACNRTATMADEASQSLRVTLNDMDIIDDCAREVASASQQQSALAVQVEKQASHLLDLGNQSVSSSESAHQESEQLGNHVDQAQLLTSHFLHMLRDRLRLSKSGEKQKEFPEPAQ